MLLAYIWLDCSEMLLIESTTVSVRQGVPPTLKTHRHIDFNQRHRKWACIVSSKHGSSWQYRHKHQTEAVAAIAEYVTKSVPSVTIDHIDALTSL